MPRISALPGDPDAGFTQPLTAAEPAAEADDLAKDIIWWRFPTRALDIAGVFALLLAIGAVGLWREVPALVLTAPVLALLAVVDLRDKVLPRGFVYVATAWAVLSAASVLSALLGALAVGTVYFLIWFIKPNGIGFGDIRLAWTVGALLAGNMREYYVGLDNFAFFDVFYGALFLPFLLTAVVAVPFMVLNRAGAIRRVKVPLGPSMIIGAVLVLTLPGGFFLDWSLSLTGLLL